MMQQHTELFHGLFSAIQLTYLLFLYSVFIVNGVSVVFFLSVLRVHNICIMVTLTKSLNNRVIVPYSNITQKGAAQVWYTLILTYRN